MTSNREYFDTWSEVYDAELRARSTEDLAFYRQEARNADGPVLEVGCGTGRIYLELLDDGVDADGIDVSTEMLDRLRMKADERGLDPRVRQADVADFEPDREYARVFAPADVFLYNLTIESQREALANLRAAVAPSGKLVLSYFTPDFDTICEQYGTQMTTEFEHDGETYTVESCLEFVDEVAQIVKAKRRLRDASGDLVLEAESRFKLLPKREMELLLRGAGFDEYEVYGGFDGEELTADSYHMVWVVRP